LVNPHDSLRLTLIRSVWASENRLSEIDPDEDYSNGLWTWEGGSWVAIDRDDKSEQARCKAFKIDTEQWQDDAFWVNYYNNEKNARNDADKIAETSQPRRKRRHRHDDDEILSSTASQSSSMSDVKGGGAWKGWGNTSQTYPPTPDPTPRKRTRHNSDTTTLKEDSAFVEQTNIKTEPLDNPYDSPPESTEIEEEMKDEIKDEIKDEDPTAKLRLKNQKQVADNPHKYWECAILVGEERQPYIVTKDKIRECDYLANAVHHNDELRCHVKLYEISDISVKDFQPVWEYFCSRDFRPQTIVLETNEQLEGAFTEEEKEEAVQKIAMVYLTASKLHFEGLQELCVKKLDAVTPLSVTSLGLLMRCDKLAASNDDEESTDGGMRRWLVKHTAKRFFQLMAENHMTMLRLMDELPELREEVIKTMPRYQASRMRNS
jgi:hypothetical protein